MLALTFIYDSNTWCTVSGGHKGFRKAVAKGNHRMIPKVCGRVPFIIYCIRFDDHSRIPAIYTESVKVDSISMWIVNLSIILTLNYRQILFHQSRTKMALKVEKKTF